MKSTATRIERMLEKIEALASPPRQWAGRLTVIVHELCEGQSREEAFAELKAHYPQNVVGKTVDDLNWSDDVAAAQEKVLAEHIAAHPEDAGCTVEDFRWIIHEIVSPNWRLENDRAVWDEPPPKIDVESEEDGRNDPAGAPTGNGRPEFRTPAPDSNGGGLDGYPDHHRSGVVLSFAAGLRERSRRLGRPWQPRQPK
jgi:hypothetical protein